MAVTYKIGKRCFLFGYVTSSFSLSPHLVLSVDIALFGVEDRSHGGKLVADEPKTRDRDVDALYV